MADAPGRCGRHEQDGVTDVSSRDDRASGTPAFAGHPPRKPNKRSNDPGVQRSEPAHGYGLSRKVGNSQSLAELWLGGDGIARETTPRKPLERIIKEAIDQMEQSADRWIDVSPLGGRG